MNFNFEQNQKIQYDVPGVMKGTGKIVGLSHAGSAIIGMGYIIQPNVEINNDTYPFSHFTCFEMHIKSI
jgi:hypothetical protein